MARTVLLALAFGVGATCAARPRAALALAVAIGAGGAATALVVLAHLLDGDLESFLSGRLSYPVNYANGAAALLFLAVPPLVVLAAAEPLRPLVRAPLGALAALVLAVGATAESRGGTIAVAGALVAVPVLARDRGRAGLTVLAVAAAGRSPRCRCWRPAARPPRAATCARAASRRSRRPSRPGSRPAGSPCSTAAGAGRSAAREGRRRADRRRDAGGARLRRARRPRRQPRELGRRALGRVLAPGWLPPPRPRPTPRASAPASPTATTTGASPHVAARDHPARRRRRGRVRRPVVPRAHARRERDRRALLGRRRRWPRPASSAWPCSAAVFGLSAGRRLARAARARRVAHRGRGARRHARSTTCCTPASTGSGASRPSASRPSSPWGRSPRAGRPAASRWPAARTRAVGAAVAVAGALLVLPLYVANRAVVRGQEQAATLDGLGDRRPRPGRRRRPLRDRAADRQEHAAGGRRRRCGRAGGGRRGRRPRPATTGPPGPCSPRRASLAGDRAGARAAVERVAELNPRARQLAGPAGDAGRTYARSPNRILNVREPRAPVRRL